MKRKTCGKCGASIENPGPCPTCNDAPFGTPFGSSKKDSGTRIELREVELQWCRLMIAYIQHQRPSTLAMLAYPTWILRQWDRRRS